MARRSEARVRRGHTFLQEPASLPEAARLALRVADAADCWDPLSFQALDVALRRSRSELKSGEALSAERALAKLRPGRRPVRHYDVQLSLQAAEHAAQIRFAFATTPAVSPGLFAQELEVTLCALEAAPHVGVSLGCGVPELKCIRMPRSPARVFYDVLERRRLVRVYAIWHSALVQALAAE